MLSYARFLCNRARELLERDALKAIDVCVLVEIAHHVHRRPLFIYELEELARFIARLSLSLCRLPLSLCRSSHSAGFLCVSFSTTSLAERFCLVFRVGFHIFSRQPQLVQASALYIM